ncbi:hypothetical protein [Alteraurantiacibacter aestuarii]|uniref:hypothetical protein n=1 Tax=Alteraurantiacibacter aestuarii TaxID=650004 RepID=UPI0031CEE532
MDRPVQDAEDILRGELQRGDLVIATTRPILRHLLATSDQSLFSDMVIARVRGMIGHVARQLLFARGQADGVEDLGSYADLREARLTQMLMEDSAFLAHAHAQTLEMQLADQLQRRSGIDLVLSPLLQELAASTDAQMAALSMRVLAEQARFVQQQRRMELPLAELPGDLFHRALLILRTLDDEADGAQRTEAGLRDRFDESNSRLGLITRLIMGMGKTAPRALAIDHGGLAVFATALAMASGQDRNLAIYSFGENQIARLALSMRAAGLKPSALEEQILYIHPDISMPAGLDMISGDQAAAMLASSMPDVAG